MSISQSELQDLIKKAFPDAKVNVVSLLGDNEHYSIKIVSQKFAGKSRLEQHRMVYSVLNGKDIHALQIQTSSE